MRYAILSDIHANLEAFRTAVEYLESENIDRYIFLGDIIGYGANPNECLEIIKNSYKYYGILGNHDAIMINKHTLSYYNPYARKCLDWTKSVLSPQNRQFLQSLPMTRIVDDIQIVHGSPVNPDAWEYMADIDDVRENLDYINHSIFFFGHTHKPAFYIYDIETDILTEPHDINSVDILSLDKYRYIVNVGSIGQPRDGNPMTSFGIYDTNQQQIKVIRLEYDTRTACQKILNAGLPSIIAQRILTGQ